MADPEVADMFAGLKKKKKKVTLMDAPTTSSSNGDTLHGSVKETGTVEPVRPLEKDADLTLKDDEPLDFSNLKKVLCRGHPDVLRRCADVLWLCLRV